MPRGSKSKYTGKQKRTAAHIEDSYVERGVKRAKQRVGHGPRLTNKMAAEEKVVPAVAQRSAALIIRVVTLICAIVRRANCDSSFTQWN